MAVLPSLLPFSLAPRGATRNDAAPRPRLNRTAVGLPMVDRSAKSYGFGHPARSFILAALSHGTNNGTPLLAGSASPAGVSARWRTVANRRPSAACPRTAGAIGGA